MTSGSTNRKRKPHNTQTAKLTNLLKDLERNEIQTHIQTLGFGNLVAHVKENNQIFAEIRFLQTQEKSEAILGLVKSTRVQVQSSFQKYCAAVNALIIVKNDAKYDKLARQINTLLDRYLSRNKSAQKKKAAEDENKESNEA